MKQHIIDTVEIPFDSTWQNVAISLSGGADSALLAYIICTLTTTQTIHVISHTRMWKTRPWQGWDSLNVYNWLVKQFPNINFKRHVNFIAPDIEYGSIGPSIIDEYGKSVSGDNIQQRAYAEYICSIHYIDAYYNAVTHNPRTVDLDGMNERDVDRTEDNKHLEYMIHMGVVASHPFRFVDKAWVIAQYKRLGIDHLFSITRSCEGEFKNITYENYTPGQFVPVCGECFWCKEREWAIEQNK